MDVPAINSLKIYNVIDYSLRQTLDDEKQWLLDEALKSAWEVGGKKRIERNY